MSSVGLLPRKMTYSELLLLPEDGPRIELYDGEVWEMPSASVRHQQVSMNTAFLLREYENRAGGRVLAAPLDVIFSELNVVQPDVLYFVPERVALLNMDPRPRQRPDLVVEIGSPTTKHNDRGRKLRMFARYEVPEYWILEIDSRAIEIRSLRGSFYEVTVEASGDAVVTSPLLQDLSFPLPRLFENVISQNG
jgi:Uma2 family endonuclease